MYTIHLYYEDDKARWVAEIDPTRLFIHGATLQQALNQARAIVEELRSGKYGD